MLGALASTPSLARLHLESKAERRLETFRHDETAGASGSDIRTEE